MYAILNIFILCMVACWHGIVASFWDKDTANIIDNWLSLAIAVLIVIVNCVFAHWYFIFKTSIWKLKKKEKNYIQMYNNSEKGTLKIARSSLNFNF